MPRPLLMLPVLAIVLSLAACDRASPDKVALDPPSTMSPSIDQPSQDVPPATAPATTDGPARYGGYGDMVFGMNAEEVRAAWDGELNGTPEASPGCYHLNPIRSDPADGTLRPPSYFAFMIEGDKFVRYDVGNDQEVAPGGGKVGMTATQIEALYPQRVNTSPHKYVDGQYLRIKGDDGSGGVLVFETEADGRVSQWRVGQPPAVDYVEGCS